MTKKKEDALNEAGEVEEPTTPLFDEQEQVEEVAPLEDQAEPDEVSDTAETPEKTEESRSVLAKTHTRKKVTKGLASRLPKLHKIIGVTVGAAALGLLVVSGLLSQYFKHKTLPNVYVAGVNSGAKTETELRQQLEAKQKLVKISFKSDQKTFSPDPKEIELSINIDQTIKSALDAKRSSGILAKLAFWQKVHVPVQAAVNDTLLLQYVEKNVPELLKSPQDAQLQFDAASGSFIITEQADGQGIDTKAVKNALQTALSNLSSVTVPIHPVTKGPKITETKLKPLLEPATELTERKVVLSGLGYTYVATKVDIASWLTPTPQADGSLKLEIDAAKVQSYVANISSKISHAPVDKKILKDETTGAEVVLQHGRDGTELADQEALAAEITKSLQQNKDVTKTMNIKTAAYQVVNMDTYDKWIEVDISEQRVTAYERAVPIKTFTIASGMPGHETVLGEFAIWLKVRKQTMQGGSKADGSYYSIPNVEWVSYFYKDYALHGAWWRKQFGYPASHGCVNMSNSDAEWVYGWAPVGTKVIVHM